MAQPEYSKVLDPLPHHEVKPVADGHKVQDVIIVGGGLAGISAAIYLGRARRDVLVIDSGDSLAQWEPVVQNYLGFPDGISGPDLLKRGKQQAEKYDVQFAVEEVKGARKEGNEFVLDGIKHEFRSRRLLLATGLYHLPPEIPCVNDCLGHSMFFCKDCDGIKVLDKRVLIVGQNDDAVEYALGMLCYSPCVLLCTNGKNITWDEQHAGWLKEYEIPVHAAAISRVDHEKGKIHTVAFADETEAKIDFLFTTRGDVFHNQLAKSLGAEIDAQGQVIVDHLQRTNISGLYAAGCITPANCQMIIAAGDGAAAAQAINRGLFEETLATHKLHRCRGPQLASGEAMPEITSRK